MPGALAGTSLLRAKAGSFSLLRVGNVIEIARILRGWYLIEMLTPQTMTKSWFDDDELDDDPDEQPKSKRKPVIVHTNSEGDVVLPWQSAAADEERVFDPAEPALNDAVGDDEEDDDVDDDAADPNLPAYTIFLGIMPCALLYDIVRNALRLEPDERIESSPARVALAAMDLTEDGRFLPNSLRISTVPWYAAKIRKSGLATVLSQPVSAAFDDFSKDARSRCVRDPSEPASGDSIRQLVTFIQRACDIADLSIDFAAAIVRRTGDPLEDKDVLNSFYHADIASAITSADKGKTPPLLRALFEEPASRVDTRAADGFLGAACTARNVAQSAWPYKNARLALMQHVALLAAGSPDSGCILAVNGPPGTGKTTLIRSIVADRFVERAKRLAELENPADAWTAMRPGATASGQIYRVATRIAGFEILVSSANNDAIGNITHDLPLEKNVETHFDKFEDAGYFMRTSDHVANSKGPRQPKNPDEPRRRAPKDTDVKTWGLFCAVLGNKYNRLTFVDALLGSPRHADDRFTTLPQEMESTEFLPWPDAVRGFREAVAALEAIVRVLPATDASWNAKEPRCRELAPPFVSDEVFAAQTNVFLAALRLHKSFICESWEQLYDNLRSWAALVRAPYAFEGSECERIALWRSAFLVIPVMSTTFASARLMLDGIPAGALELTIIDEAGQAIPQAATGLLSRASRAIVIGDPLQLEPIVSLPDAIIERIAETYGGDQRFYATTTNGRSLQTVADRASVYGATRNVRSDGADDSKVQPAVIGLPLLVHRRCIEPMFSISNAFYDEAMISATDPPDDFERGLPFGSACWIDERSAVSPDHNHTVLSQVDLAVELVLRNLRANDEAGLPSPEISIITPFREADREIRSRLNEGGLRMRTFVRRTGTVHRFQGKEAETVIFVLGLDHQHGGAVKFASRRINLLNVAVTRAKYRLYVIGDRSLWGKAGPFADLATALAGDHALTVEAFRARSPHVFSIPTVLLADVERTRASSANRKGKARKTV